ncbi:MAG TPA: anti-sigma factor [Candidatus Didemnitutus sp.]|nr:anti-sigma factor [Candidatus Didemnitutus sp.]
MNDSFDETATLYLLDELEAPARADFEAQVARDPAQAERLRELERDFEARIRELPQQAPPPRAWMRVQAAIGEKSVAARAPVIPWLGAIRWGLAAAFLIGLGGFVVHELRPPAADVAPGLVVADLGSNGGRVALSPATPVQDADERFRQLAVLARRYWDAPTEAPAGDRAYALFDPEASEGFIGVRHLAPPANGRHYHLWIVDAATNRAQDLGELPLDGAERGLYHFSVTPENAARAARVDFLVTAEASAAGPLTKPAGDVVMGTRQSAKPF